MASIAACLPASLLLAQSSPPPSTPSHLISHLPTSTPSQPISSQPHPPQLPRRHLLAGSRLLYSLLALPASAILEADDDEQLLEKVKEDRRKKIQRRGELTAFKKETVSDGQPDYTPLVKICGVTNVSDAVMAAKAGAQFVGMILWPKSKRSVSLDVAKAIADAAREHGAKPVGVFVDEDAMTIEKICNATGITFAQLHGDGARSALQFLPSSLHVIYTLNTDKDGVIQTALPENIQVDWILIDSLQGGSGEKFDWRHVNISTLPSRHGWLLAGGLTPENVAEAIAILRPDAVDVSSGIAGADGILKDPARVARFMDAL